MSKKIRTGIMDFNLTRIKVTLGGNITSTRMLFGEAAGAQVTVTFMTIIVTEKVRRKRWKTASSISYHRSTTGTWLVQAAFAGNFPLYECESATVMATVEKQSFSYFYGLHIVEASASAKAALAPLILRKYRE